LRRWLWGDKRPTALPKPSQQEERMRIRLEAVMAAACLALAPFSPTVAQSYPARPVHIIVAFAPGGPVDVVARLAAEKLPEILGQPVVVDNRPSSTGNLGTQVVAKAPPDGYTILATSSAFAVNVSLSPNAGYDPDRDFAPIIQAATQPNVIVVNSEFSAKTLAELLEMAKTAKLAYASPGTGTTPHLTGEHIFKAIANLDVTHIPYKGAGPATVYRLARCHGAHPIHPLRPATRARHLECNASSAAARGAYVCRAGLPRDRGIHLGRFLRARRHTARSRAETKRSDQSRPADTRCPRAPGVSHV
jgi:hypothetical protein